MTPPRTDPVDTRSQRTESSPLSKPLVRGTWLATAPVDRTMRITCTRSNGPYPSRPPRVDPSIARVPWQAQPGVWVRAERCGRCETQGRPAHLIVRVMLPWRTWTTWTRHGGRRVAVLSFYRSRRVTKGWARTVLSKRKPFSQVQVNTRMSSAQ